MLGMLWDLPIFCTIKAEIVQGNYTAANFEFKREVTRMIRQLSGLFVLLLVLAAPFLSADVIEQNTPAPELVGGPWLNTRNGAPLTLSSRRGQVTIVEFWTFS